jgi:hypoxanthine phosphoribosyltransferase
LKKELLIPREVIQERVRELARLISSDYQGKRPILIGVLNGVVFFFADLVREISIPVRIDFLRAKSYESRMTSCGSISVIKDVEIAVQGEPIILIEDIVDTGLTLSTLVKDLTLKEPESIRTCALIDKTERRVVPFSVDYVGFHVSEGFLVGYGLDYNEEYRNMSDIYALRVPVE